MSIDTQAQAMPVGIIPEYEYGVALNGFAGVNTFGTGSPVYSPGAPITGWTEIQVVGMRMLLEDTPTPSVQYYRTIVDYNESTGDITFDSPPGTTLTGGSWQALLIPLEFSHRVDTFEPEQDLNKDQWGGVGSGPVDDKVTMAGEDTSITWTGKKGRDLFRFYPYKNAVSSIIARLWSADGVVDPSTGAVTFRGEAADTSEAPSFTAVWAIKPGEYRIVPGCVVLNTEEVWGEEQEALTSFDGDLACQRLIDQNEDTEDWLAVAFVKPLEEGYCAELMTSHGSTVQEFKNKWGLALPYNKDDTDPSGWSTYDENEILRMYGTWGWEVGDSIVCTSHDDQQATRIIGDIDHKDRLILLTSDGVTPQPLTFNMEDQTSWVEHELWISGRYKLGMMTLKNMSGISLHGDITRGVRYRTDLSATKFAATNDISFRRSSMVPYMMQKEEAQFCRILQKITEYESEDAQLIPFPTMVREYEWGIVNAITEEITQDKTEIADELSCVMVGSPTLSIYPVG